jgi:hypothetical protein
MHNSERVVDTAQVLLTGYDVGLSRNWREEDRRWRREDMDWREHEQRCLQLDYAFMSVLLRFAVRLLVCALVCLPSPCASQACCRPPEHC